MDSPGKIIVVERLTHSAFLEHLNDEFELHGTEKGISCLSLIRVVNRTTGRVGYRQPFSIEFRGPVEPILPQGIHRLGHHVMGELDIFLVPVGPDQEGMVYEAVFN